MEGNPLLRGFPWYIWTAIGFVICIIFTLIVVLTPFTPHSTIQTDVLKCAIVDQLYDFQPNDALIDFVTGEFEKLGFEVDIYKGDEITVDFYEQLPGKGYKLILFRVHAGLLENETGLGDKIWLFTNEPYSRMRYYFAQLRDQVTAARTIDSEDPVYAISSKFIMDCMRHNFADTVIINMGCATFYNEDLAQAFVNRGASAYMAWDVSVGLQYVDDAVMTLVEKLCTEELTIEQAVAGTMEEKGPDPNNNAVLKFYPSENADKTVRQLVE